MQKAQRQKKLLFEVVFLSINTSIIFLLVLAVCAPVFARRRPGRTVRQTHHEPVQLGQFESFNEYSGIENNLIDALVISALRKKGILPANLCSHEIFMRRVYLDLNGTLPEPQEIRSFLQNRSPHKRRALINKLLKREEFADYWSLKWCDLLRVKAEFPINLWPNAVQAYHRWIHDSIRDN